jgi:hypothetical protein
MVSAIRPKWGGYAPTIAKDVNKHKVQKLQKYINELKKEIESNQEIDLFNAGYKQAQIDMVEDLLRLVK